MKDLLMVVTGCVWEPPDWAFMLLQVLIYTPLACVRRIKSFGVTALIADVFILLGLAFILVFDIITIGKTGVQKVPLINFQSFSLFVGTAMFAFEGICLMLPIVHSMEKPDEFKGVLTKCILTVSGIFITIGTLGYIALGDKVQANIFFNLPLEPVGNSLQFIYIVAIILSFPLTIYPAVRITEDSKNDFFKIIVIFGLITGRTSVFVKWQKNAYRALLCMFLGTVSWFGASSLVYFFI